MAQIFKTAYTRSFLHAVTRFLFMISRQKSVSLVLSALQHPSIERVVNIYTTQFPFYLKTSFLTNTKNLAKTKEMLHNLFNLSSLKTKQSVKETCKPHVQWREESNINVMQRDLACTHICMAPKLTNFCEDIIACIFTIAKLSQAPVPASAGGLS